MLRITGIDIEGKHKTYAIVDEICWNKITHQEGTQWYSSNNDGIQVSQMRYDKGKVFKAHHHKTYPKTAYLTQECMVCIKGKIKFILWDDRKELLYENILYPGQVLIIYGGWHEFKILEDETLIIETKNGPYTSVETDKEYM